MYLFQHFDSIWFNFIHMMFNDLFEMCHFGDKSSVKKVSIRLNVSLRGDPFKMYINRMRAIEWVSEQTDERTKERKNEWEWECMMKLACNGMQIHWGRIQKLMAWQFKPISTRAATTTTKSSRKNEHMPIDMGVPIFR